MYFFHSRYFKKKKTGIHRKQIFHDYDQFYRIKKKLKTKEKH